MIIATGRPRGSFIVAACLLLLLVSPQALAESDRLIKQDIEEAVANTPELKSTNVGVAVENRSVILFGSVGLYLHKMLYEQIAWRTTGVLEVDDEIQVMPRAPMPDAAIERKIWEIVKLHEQFHAAEIKVSVNGGGVLLGAAFGHPQDVMFLKKRVAAIQGVIAIDIDVAFRA